MEEILTFSFSTATTLEKYYILTTDGNYEVRRSNAPLVTDFSFPLTDPEEVERLECAVSQSDRTREEYVNFLSHQKPSGMPIVQFLPMVFSDEALDGYNYNGSNTLGKCKLPMKGYDIFSHCFLDAFSAEGLDSKELATQMTAAIKQSRNRMRQRTFRAKRSIKKLLNHN